MHCILLGQESCLAAWHWSWWNAAASSWSPLFLAAKSIHCASVYMNGRCFRILQGPFNVVCVSCNFHYRYPWGCLGDVVDWGGGVEEVACDSQSSIHWLALICVPLIFLQACQTFRKNCKAFRSKVYLRPKRYGARNLNSKWRREKLHHILVHISTPELDHITWTICDFCVLI